VLNIPRTKEEQEIRMAEIKRNQPAFSSTNHVQLDIQKNVAKLIEKFDEFLINITELYEKVDSNDAYTHGMLPALVIEVQNHRIAFKNIFEGLNLPYDEIDGWDDLNDKEKKKMVRRSFSVWVRDFFRKRKKKNR